MQVDEWQYNTFELDSVSEGRPLSTLAFFLAKRANVLAAFKISDVKLARRVPLCCRACCAALQG